uniref:(California timema) hypothetical protein n=1 Tax=Timema californicum TaxID=61474 RepID=A0A7R9JB34_TIMCA|nr:unnamed protein product [Timema californicum]
MFLVPNVIESETARGKFRAQSVLLFGASLRNRWIKSIHHRSLSDNPRHRWLLSGLIHHPELTPEVINHVRWGQHVYLEWKINLQYLMKREFLATNSCDFALAEVDFLEERLAMVMAMNSPYLVVINEELRRMHQTGLIQKWLLDHLPGKDRCSISGKIAEANTHTVNLNDMQGSFFVLFLGFLVSGLLIAIECCYHKSKLSKERRVIKPFIT